MKLSCPMLVVTDIEKSRRFYEQVFLQKVILDFGENITFDGGFALQTKNSWLEFIDKTESDINFGGNNFELYFEEENFPAFLKRLEVFDTIEYLHKPKEYNWGQRVVRLYDPDKNIIEVGEAMDSLIKRFLTQGMSPEDVSNKTMFPLEVVRSFV